MSEELVIAPEKPGWSDPAETARAIAAWEAETGTALPEPYRGFLVRFNGGFPYPNLFDVPAEVDPVDTMRIADRLYTIQAAAEFGSGAVYGAATPQGYAMIGEDPGGLILLLGLAGAARGAVYLWPATATHWGEEDNAPASLVKQADSFEAFLAGLYDTPDRIGHDHWHTPFGAANAQPLTLE